MLFVVKLELEIAEKWIDIEDEEEEEIANAELDEDLEALAGWRMELLIALCLKMMEKKC